MQDKKLTYHVALVGDSIFDNGGYVSPEPDVCSQLLELIEKVTLCAVDGQQLRLFISSYRMSLLMSITWF
jgi:hypothetical protein